MATEQPKTYKVTILKDGHTHAALPCEKGDVIDCTEPEARWLEANKIGKSEQPMPPIDQPKKEV